MVCKLLLYIDKQLHKILSRKGSKPHFLDADPQLLRNVEGLKPNRSAHDVFVNFEAVIVEAGKLSSSIASLIEHTQIFND